jgi:large-conductance mechanosensitive channel
MMAFELFLNSIHNFCMLGMILMILVRERKETVKRSVKEGRCFDQPTEGI